MCARRGCVVTVGNVYRAHVSETAVPCGDRELMLASACRNQARRHTKPAGRRYGDERSRRPARRRQQPRGDDGKCQADSGTLSSANELRPQLPSYVRVTLYDVVPGVPTRSSQINEPANICTCRSTHYTHVYSAASPLVHITASSVHHGFV